MPQRQKRGRGRPPNGDTVPLKSTLVRDTVEQMELLKQSGHSFSEAFRLGSRILTRVKLPVDLKLDEINEMIDKAEIDIAEALERKQVLVNTKRELLESEETKRQKEDALAARIEILVKRIHTVGKTIRNNEPHKRLVLEGISDVMPPEIELSWDEIDSFMKSGRYVPSIDSVRDFVLLHQKILNK